MRVLPEWVVDLVRHSPVEPEDLEVVALVSRLLGADWERKARALAVPFWS